MRVRIVFFLLLIFNLITITIARRCSPSFESCPCGKTGIDVHIKIKRCPSCTSGVPCRPCKPYYRSQLCSRFENCTNCQDWQKGGCSECGPNKYGRFCQKDCGCLNGGTCTKIGSCTCKSGFVGNHCQTKKVLDCGHPTEPIYGNMVLTKTTEGGVATYSCPENHLLYGPKIRTCSDTGQWSGNTPTCEYTCPVPQQSDHMIVDIGYLSFEMGDYRSDIRLVRTANFQCEEGFALVGQDTLNCLPGGIWNGKQPKCDCGCLNGGTCTKIGSCTCKSGFVGNHCQTKKVLDCGHPTEPIYGNMVLTKTTEGGVATYSCPENHLLYGPKIRTCSDTGQWSGNTPTCEYTCPVPQQSDHMIVDIGYLSFEMGDYRSDIRLVRTANFQCEEGFALVGQDTLNCLPGGIWNGKQPKCVQNCLKPFNVDHGDMIGSHFLHGSKVQFKCHQTYRLIGADTIICDQGHWDYSSPICVPEPKCPELKIKYGEVHYKGNRMIGTEAIILCDTNYILSGSRIRMCEDTGRIWSGEEAVCIPVYEDQEDNDNECNTDEPENGSLIKRGDDDWIEYNHLYRYEDQKGHDERVIYKCKDGYYLKGERDNFCVNGKWMKEIPLCIKVITCPDLVAPKGCSRCFGKDCSNSWKPIADCVPRISDVHIPNDRFPNGTVIEFIEDPVLYSLSGSRCRTCQNDGKWSGPETVCEQICGKPSSSVLKRNKLENPRGKTAVRGQWPWQASIYWETDGYPVLNCGGFLIYDQWIVTAAHCVTNARGKYAKDEDVSVTLGHVEKQYVKAPHLQVDTFHTHPDYKVETYASNIALVRLKKSVEFNRWIRPVCLPKSKESSNMTNMTGIEGIVTGWGGSLPHLKMTKVRIIDQEVCRQFYREQGIDNMVSDNHFCARVVVSNQSDVCSGDSGGPLVIQDKEGSWQVIGMVSWGAFACNSPIGGMDVYIRVQNFIDWIELITGIQAPP